MNEDLSIRQLIMGRINEVKNDDNEALLRCTKDYLRYEIENKNPNFQCRYCSHFPSPEDIDNVSVRLNEKGGLEIHLNICKTHSHKI